MAPKNAFGECVAARLASIASPQMRRQYRRGLRILQNQGVHSFAALTRALPGLRGVAAWTGICILEQQGRRAAPSLVSLLAIEALAAEAAKALANLGGARARRGCTRLLDGKAPKPVRYAATYALAYMRDDEAASTLMALVRDRHEAEEVRGQAAEGLDYLGREGGPHRRAAARTALHGLDDPSPVVRFWCAFALGAMRFEPAVPALERLARQDKAMCPGWWQVCDEAADAVAMIEGREPPARRPRGR